jgi:hypothetical protein
LAAATISAHSACQAIVTKPKTDSVTTTNAMNIRFIMKFLALKFHADRQKK